MEDIQAVQPTEPAIETVSAHTTRRSFGEAHEQQQESEQTPSIPNFAPVRASEPPPTSLPTRSRSSDDGSTFPASMQQQQPQQQRRARGLAGKNNRGAGSSASGHAPQGVGAPGLRRSKTADEATFPSGMRRPAAGAGGAGGIRGAGGMRQGRIRGLANKSLRQDSMGGSSTGGGSVGARSRSNSRENSRLAAMEPSATISREPSGEFSMDGSRKSMDGSRNMDGSQSREFRMGGSTGSFNNSFSLPEPSVPLTLPGASLVHGPPRRHKSAEGIPKKQRQVDLEGDSLNNSRDFSLAEPSVPITLPGASSVRGPPRRHKSGGSVPTQSSHEQADEDGLRRGSTPMPGATSVRGPDLGRAKSTEASVQRGLRSRSPTRNATGLRSVSPTRAKPPPDAPGATAVRGGPRRHKSSEGVPDYQNGRSGRGLAGKSGHDEKDATVQHGLATRPSAKYSARSLSPGPTRISRRMRASDTSSGSLIGGSTVQVGAFAATGALPTKGLSRNSGISSANNSAHSGHSSKGYYRSGSLTPGSSFHSGVYSTDSGAPGAFAGPPNVAQLPGKSLSGHRSSGTIAAAGAGAVNAAAASSFSKDQSGRSDYDLLNESVSSFAGDRLLHGDADFVYGLDGSGKDRPPQMLTVPETQVSQHTQEDLHNYGSNAEAEERHDNNARTMPGVVPMCTDPRLDRKFDLNYNNRSNHNVIGNSRDDTGGETEIVIGGASNGNSYQYPLASGTPAGVAAFGAAGHDGLDNVHEYLDNIGSERDAMRDRSDHAAMSGSYGAQPLSSTRAAAAAAVAAVAAADGIRRTSGAYSTPARPSLPDPVTTVPGTAHVAVCVETAMNDPNMDASMNQIGIDEMGNAGIARKKKYEIRQKHKVCAWLSAFLLVAIVAGVVVGVLVSKGGDNDAVAAVNEGGANVTDVDIDSEDSSSDEDIVATRPPGVDAETYLLSTLPGATFDAIGGGESGDSPQWKAWVWLVADPQIERYSVERLLQRFSLATMYYATNGESWPKKDNWLSYEHHECSWSEVKRMCDEGTDLSNEEFDLGTITELDLSENMLDGNIPREIGLMSKLVTVTLSNNNLQGSIPSEIEKLSRLERLYLQFNQLTGSIPDLRAMTNMKDIFLDDNKMTNSIPAAILGGQLKQLNRAQFSDNLFTGSIPATVGSLSTLVVLALDGNAIVGSIPSELGEISTLRQLSLHKNKLNGPIPSTLSGLSSLERLILHTNSLTSTIPKGLTTKLREFSLDSNELTGSIHTELGLLTNLGMVWLFNNELTGQVPSELGLLTKLAVLTLDQNPLTGSLPLELNLLSSMQNFNVSFTQLTGTFPEAFCEIEKREYTCSLGLMCGCWCPCPPAGVSTGEDNSTRYLY